MHESWLKANPPTKEKESAKIKQVWDAYKNQYKGNKATRQHSNFAGHSYYVEGEGSGRWLIEGTDGKMYVQSGRQPPVIGKTIRGGKRKTRKGRKASRKQKRSTRRR